MPGIRVFLDLALTKILLLSTISSNDMDIKEARGIAARCWCDERTSDRVMDPELAEVFAETICKLLEETENETGKINVENKHTFLDLE